MFISKGHGKDFGELPFLPTLPDISFCEIGGPLQPSVPVHFYYVILKDKYS